MNYSQSPLVSVIVPIYNGESFIKNCIESILNQSYKSIEIIIVDDGSTDNSLHICNQLAKEHGNIRLYSQENKGVSAARNLGLEKANGKYIGFADCDDKIQPLFYQKLVETIERDDSDIVFDGRKYCDANFNILFEDTFPIADGRYTADEVKKLFLLPLLSRGQKHPFKKPLNYGSACICLFKASFLSGLRFAPESELSVAEDLVFQLYALKKATVVSKISYSGYLYYSTDNHQSRSNLSKVHRLDRRLSLMQAIANFRQSADSIEHLEEYAAAGIVREFCYCIFTDSAQHKNFLQKYRLIKKYLSYALLADSVKKIYGEQEQFKDKILMFMLKHKTALVFSLYASLK